MIVIEDDDAEEISMSNFLKYLCQYGTSGVSLRSVIR
jgi:hypothetical protein